MSSGRGPGVIGMVMALVVLLGFGLLFTFAFDEGLQGGPQSIESVIAQQARDIASDQRSIDAGRVSLATIPTKIANTKELSRLKHANESQRANCNQLVTSVASGQNDLIRNSEAFETYKNEYRTVTRSKAKGEAMDKLETLDGTVYTRVNIREVTAIGMQIRHEGGQTRVNFEELSEEIKDRFQFDPKQKEQALIQESKTRDHHEAAVAVAESAADKQQDQQREVDTAKAKEKCRREIALKEGQVKALENEIRGLNSELDRAAAAAAAARAAGRMHLSKSNTISGTIRSKQNRMATLKSEIYQLSATL